MTEEIKQALSIATSPMDKKHVQTGETQGAYPTIFMCNHNFDSYSRGKLLEF